MSTKVEAPLMFIRPSGAMRDTKRMADKIVLRSPRMGEGVVLPGILEQWIAALEGAHVLMGPREAVSSELARWIALIGPAIEGDQASSHELFKLVAFHARGLGA